MNRVRTIHALVAFVLVAGATPPLLAIAHAATTAAAATCAPAEHAGGEWRSFGGDYSNTRNQPLETTITPAKATTLEPAFAFSASQAGGTGDFTGTPVIADGCLFMGSNAGWVFAANADTGEPVWSTQLPDGGGINSSVNVTDGVVYAAVSRGGTPYVVALDEATGAINWQTQIDDQVGSDVYGSPVLFDGVLFEGVSGGSAELGDESDRYAFQGAFVLLETRNDPLNNVVAGTILKKTYTVHPPQGPDDTEGGATIWSTPAVDPATKMAYVGTGNPFHPQQDDANSDAIVKIDLDRASATFGEIVASYKGVTETYTDRGKDLPCKDLPGNPPPYYPQGVGSCAQLDLDFGAAPNLWTAPDGHLVVGEGQKSGWYHAVNATTMKGEWKKVVGPPSAVGGIVGSTAIDDGNVYGPIVPAGYLWSLGKAAGKLRWAAPTADGAHWGNPVSIANGVVYTVDLKGFLNAYDAATGRPVLARPMAADIGAADPVASWGGVSIARNTVYAAVGMTGLPNGYVVGYRAAGAVAPPELPSVPSGPVPGAGGGGAATRIVSGPQAQFYGYLTPAMVVKRGGKVIYSNIDIVQHNVIQDVNADGRHGNGTASWCSGFPAGKCPLFYAPLQALGKSTTVLGVDKLSPGVYSFYCGPHPGMKGKLVVR